MENENFKLGKIIRFLVEQKDLNPNISSFEADDINEQVFENKYNINEIEYLCRKLIKEKDVFGGTTRDGIYIGHSAATNDAIFSSKYSPKMMKIFISHSSKNKSYGNLIVELLRSLGIKEDEIIFTSNAAYGIPLGKNIFHWLKSQITEKPFVIYLLSDQYYKSVACLNEMGAAWIIENDHAAIFTPDFDLSSKDYLSGALDPREIGFHIDDEDRIYSFIQVLSKSFSISNNNLLISQIVKKFIKEVKRIIPEEVSKNQPNKKVEVKQAETTIKKEDANVQKVVGKPVQFEKRSLYSKFLELIKADKLKQDELLLLHYIIDTGKSKLMTGSQEKHEILDIQKWEKMNDIKDILSKDYSDILKTFEMRGFMAISAVTSYGNTKEFKLKDEIASNILDLPDYIIAKIDEAVQNNFLEHEEEDKDEEDDDLLLLL